MGLTTDYKDTLLKYLTNNLSKNTIKTYIIL